MAVENEDMTGSKLSWTTEIDEMLADWCDQSKSFEWMHTEAYSRYDKKSKIIMIASNVLTAVCGLSNVIAGGTIVNGFQLSWVFGSLSICISITNMLQEKLAYNTKAIEHRQYSNSWGVIRRKIEEELVIPRGSRKDCKSFLKFLRQDINQVSVDGNTKIPKDIRAECYSKFSAIPNFDLPDICGDMERTKIYVDKESSAMPLLNN
jgi:chloramphenicol O-acetyltransferase